MRASGAANAAAVPSSRPTGRPAGRFTQHHRMSELRQLLVQHPSGLTLAEIAAHLDVTPRSARRYLRELRFDLETAPARAGGKKRWRIPAVDLPRRVAVRRTQAYALLAARPLFEPLRGSAVHDEINLAAESLLGVARRPGRGPNGGLAAIELEQRFRYVPFAPKDYRDRSEDLDSLFQAVANLQPLECDSPAATADPRRRRIHPYALVLYKDAVLAIGVDAAERVVRAFELDELCNARCLERERFELPADFRVDDYVQGQFGLKPCSATPTAVVIDFDPRVAEQVASRRFHPSQRLTDLGNGGKRLELALPELSELTPWVLGFGPMAVVREPAALRESVRAALAQALACYPPERPDVTAAGRDGGSVPVAAPHGSSDATTLFFRRR